MTKITLIKDLNKKYINLNTLLFGNGYYFTPENYKWLQDKVIYAKSDWIDNSFKYWTHRNVYDKTNDLLDDTLKDVNSRYSQLYNSKINKILFYELNKL